MFQASAAAFSQPSSPRRRRGRAGSLTAPRDQFLRRVAQEGLRQQEARIGADRGMSLGPARGKESTRECPDRAKRRRNWSSTMSGRAPTTSRDGARSRPPRRLGHQGGQAGVLALGEGGLDAAAGIVDDPQAPGHDDVSRWAARDRSSLMTSEGHDPTRKSMRMSGRRASSSSTTRSSSSLASASPARSRSSMIAVAKRGSANTITPAADWIRWAQVRDPTTRKKAS
jgi:hypothetical protein